MKRGFVVPAAVALCLFLIAGCSAETPAGSAETTGAAQSAKTTGAAQTSEGASSDRALSAGASYESFVGDWSLKVSEDEELYRMTGLAVYYGATGIGIKEIKNNHVKGTVYSVSGAPGYRQANVDFEGDIADGKLKASYQDEGWLYSGDIELAFETDAITANITREKSDDTPLWGIPEGEFTFLRSIETETAALSDAENGRLASFLSAVTETMIQPFEEGGLTDGMIIDFVGLNLGMGSVDVSEFGDRVKSDVDIVFDESVMNTLSDRYFGIGVKQPKSTDIVGYGDGFYTVPALGGIMERPVVQILMEDKENEGVCYAIVDYMLETPEGAHLEYQHLIILQKKNDAFIIKSIKKVVSPIDFELFNAIS